MGNFDVKGALAEGYSLDEISAEVKFDIKNARKEGYSDEEIKNYLAGEASTTKSKDTPKQNKIDFQLPVGTSSQPSIVSPKDVKASSPSMNTGDIDLTGVGAGYTNLDTLPQQQQAKYEELRSQAQKKATESTFPTTFIDPRTKQQITVEPTGLEQGDLLFGPAGKLGWFGLLGPNALSTTTAETAPKVLNSLDNLMAKLRPDIDKLTLSPGAKILATTHVDVPSSTINDILKGVPEQDQSLHLALALHDYDYIKHAVAMGNDQTRAKLANILKAPSKALSDVLGDTGKQMVEAQVKYADMVRATKAIDSGKLRPVKELQELTTKLLDQFYLQPNFAQGTIKRLSAQIERNHGGLTLTDAVDMMPEINSLLGKAKNHNERDILKQLKDTMDDAITKLGNPEHRKMFEEARESYSAAKSNEAIVETVQKYTADMGRGVDWTKVHSELGELNLRSPETVEALRLTEAFASKYGNNTKLAKTATPQGVNENSGGALGAWGYVVNRLKNVALKDRREAMKVQKEILKAVNRNGTEMSFLKEVINNPRIPEEVKYTFNGTSDWTKAVAGKTPEELVEMARGDNALDDSIANEMKATFSRLRENGIELKTTLVKPENITIDQAMSIPGILDDANKGLVHTKGKGTANPVTEMILKDVATSDADKAILVAHELNHMAINGALDFAAANPNSPAGNALIYIEQMREAIGNSNLKIAKEWQNHKNNAFDNASEFISWAMSHPELKDSLKKTSFDAPNGPAKNVWDSVLNAIWDLQGVSEGPARAAYDQLVDKSLSLMKHTHRGYLGGVAATGALANSQRPEPNIDKYLPNVLKYESDKVDHGDGQTFYAGIDIKNESPKKLAQYSQQLGIKDLTKMTDDQKTAMGRLMVKDRAERLELVSPFNDEVNSKIINMMVLNNYLEKNLKQGKIKTKEDLEDYLFTGNGRYGINAKSQEARRAHHTLLDLTGDKATPEMRQAMDFMYGSIRGRLLKQGEKDTEIFTSYKEGNLDKFKAELQPYLKYISKEDRQEILRKIEG